MNFLPQNEDFFDLLDQLSGHMVTIAQQLQQMPSQPSKSAELLEKICAEEHAAEELTLSELKKLDSAFITPIDREDIMRLMSGLYEVVESLVDVALSFEGHRFANIDKGFQAPFDALHALVGATSDLMKPLRDRHKLSDMDDTFRTFRKTKKDADRTRRDGLSQLLTQENTSGIETYLLMDRDRLLHAAVDRCDAVRAMLQEVILKNS